MCVCVCGSVYALCLRYATFMTSTVAQQSQSETEREREREGELAALTTPLPRVTPLPPLGKSLFMT